MNKEIIKIDDKYSIVLQEKPYEFRATRYDEQWRDLVGDGLVLAMTYKIQEMQELLKKIEWCTSDEISPYCPICEQDKCIGHSPDCQLAKLIRGTNETA